jgi:chromosome segregation protein
MKNISLLSGGERALTATSLLFGLYLVKRSPYCILDEVDGPLDDANIGRFIKLIRQFSNETQFIIITHNKKTMAECDLLYGVTPAEPGISKMVSVSLATDEKMIDALIAKN